MGWTVYVKLTRPEVALTRAERNQLISFVAEHNRMAWTAEPFDLMLPPARRRVSALAYGAIKPARELDQPDVDRLLEVLTELRSAIPGATCEVADDDGLVVWSESGYTLGVGSQPDLIAPDTAGWKSARSLAAGARHRATRPTTEKIPLDVAIDVLDAVPRAGYATDLAENRAAAAVARVAGDPRLQASVLAAWRRTPARHGAMASMCSLVQPFVPTSWFREELLASIARAGQPGESHRAYFAADLLLRARPSDHAGLSAVIAVMRRYRLAPDSFAADPPQDDDPSEPVARRMMWLLHLWRGELSPLQRDAAVASCALALASPGSTEYIPRAIMAFGGVALLPLVARIPADHPHAIGVAHQVTHLVHGNPDALDAAVALCLRYAFHPFVSARIETARALRNLCGPTAQPLLDRAVALATREGLDSRVFSLDDIEGRPEIPDALLADALSRYVALAEPIDDLIDRDRWRRSQGVTRYVRSHAARGGPLLPLHLFDAVNELLPRHERATSPSWYDWPSLPAPLRRRAAAAERAAFIRAQATPADRAALPSLLRDVETLGAAAVAARFAAPIPAVIELSASERAGFEAAERALIA